MNLERQKRRLTSVLAFDALCLVVGAGALVGALGFQVEPLIWLFAAAIAAGFAAQVWLVIGLAREKTTP